MMMAPSICAGPQDTTIQRWRLKETEDAPGESGRRIWILGYGAIPPLVGF